MTEISIFFIIFEMIVLVIIFSAAYQKVQRRKQGGMGNGSRPNVTVTMKPQNTAGQSAVQPPHQKQTPVQAAIQEAREDGNTTTAYLMEKAAADAREHAREKYEEQKRLQETRGGLAAAERYLPGDPVPAGKRCIICGYCGAENLVPMTPRAGYSCCFCREPL